MDYVVQEYVKKNQKGSWIGSCEGMSRVVSLVKGGYIDLEELGLNSDISTLSNPKDDSRVEDLINFYQLQQCLPYVKDQIGNFYGVQNAYTSDILLKEIVKETKKVTQGGLPVLIGFRWVDTSIKGAGHSVVGYNCECVDKDGNVVDENSDSFEKYKITIYDCSATKSSGYTPTYMYIGKDYNYWYYDGLTDVAVANGVETKCIRYVISSEEELNLVDYVTGELSSVCTTSYQTSFLSSFAESGVYVRAKEKGAKITSYGAGEGDLDIYTVPNFDDAIDEDGNEISSNYYTTYFGDDFKDEDITLTLDDTNECDFSMIYSNCMVSAEGSSVNEVGMKSDGAVELQAEDSDYEVSLTFNEGYYSLPWHTVTASGESTNMVSMEQTADGIILTSDNMKDVSVYANNTTNDVELVFSSDTNSVLITNIDGDELAIYSDTDNDGSYETLVDTTSSNFKDDKEKDKDVTTTVTTTNTTVTTTIPQEDSSVPSSDNRLPIAGLMATLVGTATYIFRKKY